MMPYNHLRDGQIGFLKARNRVNVLLSRAKQVSNYMARV